MKEQAINAPSMGKLLAQNKHFVPKKLQSTSEYQTNLHVIKNCLVLIAINDVHAIKLNVNCSDYAEIKQRKAFFTYILKAVICIVLIYVVDFIHYTLLTWLSGK